LNLTPRPAPIRMEMTANTTIEPLPEGTCAASITKEVLTTS
jgi:hypothetical protein